MNILIIANGYPEKKDLQWGCFERDQALALKNAGHKVSVMYVDRRFRKYWRKIGITKKVDTGLSIYGMYYLPLGWLRDKVSYRFHQKVVMWMYDILYREYVKDHGNPDVMYAHYLWNMAYVSKLKDKYQIPFVGIEHWSGLTDDVIDPLSRYWAEMAYNRVDRLLAVSQSLQARIKYHFSKDSLVVPDMLGQEFVSGFIPNRESNGDFTFLAIGSLIYRKGFDNLLEAFAKSHLNDKCCRLIIIGDGPEKMNLIKQARQLGIVDYVNFVGRKNKVEIINIMHVCNVFVLPSRAETFGVVCIEALSQGLPNIATVCGGPEEFINEENGILIRPDDVNALSEALCQMYDYYGRYNRMKIMRECLGKFSPQVIANQLTVIFKKITV